MLILTIRTDKPDAEIGLYEGEKKLAYETWPAHRELSVTIHTKIKELLRLQQRDWQDIQGIVCFKGPGSFTGLRIGLTLGNTLAYSLGVPILSTQDDNWIEDGVSRLEKGDDEKVAMPEYGGEANITKPRK